LIVGIIGSGTMGSGIAQVAATAGCKVILLDQQDAALENAKQKLAKVMARLVEKERISEEEASAIQSRISYSVSLSDFRRADLVLEAIVENVQIKAGVFAELEMTVRKECILATNTSSLSVTELAAGCANPERFIGIHFFNPAPLMKLVEIVPALQTDPEIVTRIQTEINSWGKSTVLAKDSPGFIVNKVARPFYSESLRIYEEGIADLATIDWALREFGGFRMGPFELMDFIGNDVNFAVTSSVFKSFFFDPKYKPARTQQQLTHAGWLGRKSGKGYYDYSEGAIKPEPKTDPILGESIFNRVLLMLINEAADTMHFQIASRDDIDIAMTTGVNYPKGLLAWADELGIKKVVFGMDALYNTYHEDRYRCSPLLRKMAHRNTRFYELSNADI
jgi:3-hydroxybutyryl-CoA dehydrogenase